MLEQLEKRLEPPMMDAESDPVFWQDEYISKKLLAVHLDPHDDLASRKPGFMDRSAGWIGSLMPPALYPRLLDLGCGPGLYAQRFAKAGPGKYRKAGFGARASACACMPDGSTLNGPRWTKALSSRAARQRATISGTTASAWKAWPGKPPVPDSARSRCMVTLPGKRIRGIHSLSRCFLKIAHKALSGHQRVRSQYIVDSIAYVNNNSKQGKPAQDPTKAAPFAL